jgi:hypothetical protein
LKVSRWHDEAPKGQLPPHVAAVPHAGDGAHAHRIPKPRTSTQPSSGPHAPSQSPAHGLVGLGRVVVVVVELELVVVVEVEVVVVSQGFGVQE